MSSTNLIALSSREFSNLVKERLRADKLWEELLAPDLIERTRRALERMIASIDAQITVAVAEGSYDDPWASRISLLRAFAQERLEAMAPPSTSREAKAWRTFAATLALALQEGDQTALDTLRTPYGGMTIKQWLKSREEKGAA